MNRPRGAFTLIELLVVIAVIGILVAVLLPAVQKVREAANRVSCTNNLKQLGLSLHLCHDARCQLPVGSTFQFATSWLVDLLPYLEQGNLFAKFVFDPNNGGYIAQNPVNRAAFDEVVLPTYYCPSSPLPKLCAPVPAVYSGPVRWATSSYIGISGAVYGPDTPTGGGSGRCQTGQYGIACCNGLLLPNSAIGFARVTDGLSNTLLVGEQSDWVLNGTVLEDHRSSSRWGFPLGSRLDGTPATTLNAPNLNWAGGLNDTYQVTTVRYSVGYKVMTPDAGGNMFYGTNTALQSAHPGGANGLLGDGSVRFLSSSVLLTTLQQLAVRDDGDVIIGDD
jgi:prepilin-type N-terminal cleavage/methylation domain-containing protein/prepilin-type processing-associated H-X9-DG protein